MNAVIEELARAAGKMKRDMGDEQSLSYEFRTEGDWNTTLRQLPFTCALWAAFLKYEAARAAYEAEVDKRQRWSAEFDQLRQQLHEADEEHDPDAIDYAAYVQAQAKAKVLARRLSDPHGILNEHKDLMNRANENWGRAWSAYLEQKQQERQIAGATDVPSIPGYSAKAEALQQIRERIAQYEAPRGG